LKAADIKRQQDIELYGGQAPQAQKSDEIGDMTRTLEKLTGMKIAVVDNMPKIEYVKSPSPAYEAGLRKGDVLVSVWGKLTGYLSLKEMLDLLINKSAIEIRCTIERTSDVAINSNRTIISGIEDLIGASFAMEIDGLTVSSVKESGYAAEAGLKKEDLIMSIDGKQTRYMPLKKAVELIKNSREGTVKLVIRRKTIIWRNNEQ